LDGPAPQESMVAPLQAEIGRLRAALEHITRACDALHKGPVAVAIAREALGDSFGTETA
jgi:hypothetical protein